MDFLTSMTSENPKILKRVLFKHKNSETFLLADAYDGKCIKEAITHFLEASAGNNLQEITINDRKLPFGGNSNLLVSLQVITG